MIRHLAAAVAFAMGVAGAAVAPAYGQDGGDRSDKMRERGERMAKRFDKLDRNGDGTVDRDEVERPMTKSFRRADGNDDGAVDQDEVRALGEGRSGKRKGGGNAKRFERADENRDGRVTRDEFMAMTPRWFERSDEDRDGRVTKAELDGFLEKRADNRADKDRAN